MNKVCVLGREGSARMLFGNEWTFKEAPRRGLRDPWAHRPDGLLNVKEIMTKLGCTDKEIKFYQSVYREATEEEMNAWKIERDEYMRQRDEWLALKMFHEFGYETFLKDCRMYGLSEKFIKSVFPCESHNDSQCSLDCPIWGSCAIQKWEGDE